MRTERRGGKRKPGALSTKITENGKYVLCSSWTTCDTCEMSHITQIMWYVTYLWHIWYITYHTYYMIFHRWWDGLGPVHGDEEEVSGARALPAAVLRLNDSYFSPFLTIPLLKKVLFQFCSNTNNPETFEEEKQHLFVLSFNKIFINGISCYIYAPSPDSGSWHYCLPAKPYLPPISPYLRNARCLCL